jgi:hypothetical protein
MARPKLDGFGAGILAAGIAIRLLLILSTGGR